MSGYDEHLISLAGGDGDRLSEIEARIPQIPESEMSNAEKDRTYLLALVREQAAKLETVRQVANDIGSSGSHLNKVIARALRAAMEAS